MFFTTLFVGIGVICFMNYITKIVPENLYDTYLKPLKVEDAKQAEREQLLDEESESESESDAEEVPAPNPSGEHGDTASESDAKSESARKIDESVCIDKQILDNSKGNDVNSVSNIDCDIEVGDFITFKFNYDYDSDLEDNHDFNRARRSISTYGKEIIEPEDTYINNGIQEPQIYFVTKTHCDIPNAKGLYSYESSNEKNYNLDVIPVKNNDIERFNKGTDVEENYIIGEGIFWYVSYNDKTIRQYEDGYPLVQLDYINNVGNSILAKHDNQDDSEDEHANLEDEHGNLEDEQSTFSSDNDTKVQDYPSDNTGYNMSNYINEHEYGASCSYGPDYNFNDGDW